MRRIRVSLTSATELGLALVVAAGLASCGGSSSKPARGSAETRAVVHTWEHATWEDRHTTMTFVVLPNMGQLWQKFEHTDAPTLTCRTCHGEDAEEKKYAMPNPSLPPLDASHLPDPYSRDPHEAKWAAFMIHDVVPTMTDLLDAQPYDAKTDSGFWCFDCHTRKKS